MMHNSKQHSAGSCKPRKTTFQTAIHCHNTIPEHADFPHTVLVLSENEFSFSIYVSPNFVLKPWEISYPKRYYLQPEKNKAKKFTQQIPDPTTVRVDAAHY
jgi:hypothetical protein